MRIKPTALCKNKIKQLKTIQLLVCLITMWALMATNAMAMTVPATGSFAYDLYDIGVNQILLGPIGFVGGVGVMVIAAILAVRQMILPAACAVLGGAFLLKADTVVSSMGAMIM